MKNIYLACLFALFIRTISIQSVFAEVKLTVHIHMNGYGGNLYYRLPPDFANTRWFYVHNPKGDTTIYLDVDPNGTYDLYNGSIYLGFRKEADTVKLAFGNPSSLMLKTISPNEIDITFNTVPITIKKKCLSSPYVFSAFALIPGNTTTDGTAYNVIYNDTTVKVIKGMYYSINNLTFVTYCKNIFTTAMSCNSSFKTVINPTLGCKDTTFFYDSFTFNVNIDGNIDQVTNNAARSKRNILIFNTVIVKLDPNCISNGNDIIIPHNHFRTETIVKKKSLWVIRGLLNHLWWVDKTGNPYHLYYAQTNSMIERKQ